MDVLLELSGSVKEKLAPFPPISGFEMAAATLEPSGKGSGSSQEAFRPETSELDSTIQRELEMYKIPKNEPPPSFHSLSQSDVGRMQCAFSPITELSLGGARLPQEDYVSVDFSYLTNESSSLVTRTSAFKPHQRDETLPPVFITPKLSTRSPPFVLKREAFLKPSATFTRSWTLAPQGRLEKRVLVLLRGAPGSGKSTLAR